MKAILLIGMFVLSVMFVFLACYHGDIDADLKACTEKSLLPGLEKHKHALEDTAQ